MTIKPDVITLYEGGRDYSDMKLGGGAAFHFKVNPNGGVAVYRVENQEPMASVYLSREEALRVWQQLGYYLTAPEF